MIEGKTKTGFSFKVDPEVLDDMEFIELVANAEENGLLLPKLVVTVVGEKQKEKLYNHVRNKKGRVSPKKISDEITDIFEAINTAKETKNS